jgi:hypothetical protein
MRLTNGMAMAFIALLAACRETGEPPSRPASARPAPPASTSAPERIKVISHGGAYAREDYLIPGYVVVLDFYADW